MKRAKDRIINLNVKNLNIELERKKIKNIYLKILPPLGKIYVSAPVRMPEADIISFVLSKEEWIRSHQNKLLSQNINNKVEELELVSGEELYLWGRQYILEVSFSCKANIVVISDNKLLLNFKRSQMESRREERYAILKEWYRENLRKAIPPLLLKWEPIIGEHAKEFTIRDMKTRWGTCNVRQRRICINLQLAGRPPEALEYVLVHELVHLLERSHNHVFKAYMDSFMPDWRERRVRLKNNYNI